MRIDTPPRPNKIRVIAICLIRSGEKVLVMEGFDEVKGSAFYRALGGGVEPGETSRDAVAREIREETGLEIADLRLLHTLENIFVMQGKPYHEIVFVYEGRFADPAAYEREEFIIRESNGEVLRAVWRTPASFNERERFVPEALCALLGIG